MQHPTVTDNYKSLKATTTTAGINVSVLQAPAVKG